MFVHLLDNKVFWNTVWIYVVLSRGACLVSLFVSVFVPQREIPNFTSEWDKQQNYSWLDDWKCLYLLFLSENYWYGDGKGENAKQTISR